MNQSEKANLFKNLHQPGNPLVLYNIWDAGSARTVAAAGAKAIASGSWAVAAVQGYGDGESIPFDFVLKLASRIVQATDLPCTIDIESGYAEDPDGVAENIGRLFDSGLVGINFEDQVIGGDGLYDIIDQCARISAIKRKSEVNSHPLFINARCDVFIKGRNHKELLSAAKERAAAYADAGADCFFAPLLTDSDLIADLCAASPIPVNILKVKTAPSLEKLATLGVARVSYGHNPYVELMETLTEKASAIYAC